MDRSKTGLEALRDHEITLRKAAEREGIPYIEMFSLAADDAIDVGYTTREFERDLERI